MKINVHEIDVSLTSLSSPRLQAVPQMGQSEIDPRNRRHRRSSSYSGKSISMRAACQKISCNDFFCTSAAIREDRGDQTFPGIRSVHVNPVLRAWRNHMQQSWNSRRIWMHGGWHGRPSELRSFQEKGIEITALSTAIGNSVLALMPIGLSPMVTLSKLSPFSGRRTFSERYLGFTGHCGITKWESPPEFDQASPTESI
jgi:hypothetical protein